MSGRFDDAIALLQARSEPASGMTEGWLLIFLGQLDRAEALFSVLACEDKSRTEALKNLCLVFNLRGQLDEALKVLTTAIVRQPSHTGCLMLLSRIVRDENDITHLLQEIQRAGTRHLSVAAAVHMIRACGRAHARKAGDSIAHEAIVELATASPDNSSRRKRPIHGLPQGQFTSERGERIFHHIAESKKEIGVRLFLMGGTLLGHVRGNALLPWDKDVDFGCFGEDASVGDLWEMFSKNPYFIPMGTVEDRLIKLRHVTGVTVDIFVNHLDGDTRWHGGKFVCWRDSDFKLRTTEIDGRRFYIPENSEAYLTNHYGVTWRQPDRLFDVSWEAPDIFNVDVEHRYLHTVAKGLQLLNAHSRQNLEARLARAIDGDASDIVASYRFVLDTFDQYRGQNR
jgi:hypothetical protein